MLERITSLIDKPLVQYTIVDAGIVLGVLLLVLWVVLAIAGSAGERRERERFIAESEARERHRQMLERSKEAAE